MRLKSIKLVGFKSFVDATTVPFPTNMTAVVGPNGCGKSNIIDAVRWVMGESSAKNLRGESMTDVIFNGATGRQPVGQASIELLFDNSEGKLTGEHAAFTEISIKRKVTREGVSQYYLNGSKCRRRDVTDIFLGTGMGPRSYAIIEQGMIARLIESKPEELRVYLEEAAGISKYKERRRETENRMKRTQENLERLTDIREELNKQLQHLKRQANAAEKYAEFKKEERLTKARLDAMNWVQLDSLLSEKNKLVTDSEVRIEKFLHEKTSNESRIETTRILAEEKQEAFNKVQGKYYESGAEIARVEQQLKFQKERFERQDRELVQLRNELSSLDQLIRDEKEQLEELSVTLEELLPSVEEAQEIAETYSSELSDREAGMSVWQEDWDAFNAESSSARQTAELEQSRIQQAESNLRQLQEREQRLGRELDDLSAQSQSDEFELLSEERMTLEESCALLATELDEIKPLLLSKQEEIDKTKTEMEQVRTQLSEKKAVLASLVTLQKAALADTNSDASWMQVIESTGAEKLVKKLKVDSGYEKCIELVLAPFLTGFISDEKVLDQLDFESIQESLSLIIEADPVLPRKGSLAEKVHGVPQLNSYLNQIRPVESLTKALLERQALEDGESLAVPSGVWVGNCWLRTGPAADARSGMLEREEEIKELEAEIPGLQASLDGFVENLEAFKQEFTSLQESIREKEASWRQVEQELAKLNSRISASQAKHEQFELRLKRVRDDMQEVALNQTEQQERLVLSKEAWQHAMASLDEFADQKELLLSKREAIQQELEYARQKARELQTIAHQQQMELQQKQSQKQSIEGRLQHSQERFNFTQAKVEDLLSVDPVDQGVLDELQLTLEGMLEARLQDEERLSQARSDMEQVSATLRESEHERLGFESKIQQERNVLEGLRMECQAFEINKKALLDAIVADEYELEALIQTLDETVDEQSLQEAIEKLQARVQRLGPINLAAIDEYQSQSERKEYLDAQHEDLMEALDTLTSAIRKIDKETRIRFKETYDQVNEGLQRLFPKIFGGGSAHLELTDDDLLETGVMIIARPPGKKNATIHLLSGGEKALTAIALIFAIFELNPAPFCMLDEVDAPLDDANVGRFANMVKEMSAQVQFIYISHNKVSMEKADQLMGVTMHEPGVSRLVSVDVEEAAALVEA